MNKRTCLLGIFFLFSCLVVSAQSKKAVKKFNAAIEQYSMMEIEQALNSVNAAIGIDADYADAWVLKAEIYNKCDSLCPQIDALNHAIALGAADKYPKIYLLLAEAYYETGEYADAISAAKQFEGTDAQKTLLARAEMVISQSQEAAVLKDSPVPFNPTKLGSGVNSAANEYWPSITIDGQTLVFTRLIKMERDGKNYAPQEDFYISQLGDDGVWQAAMPITEVNTPNNEGAQSISASGDLLFFTACGRSNGYGSCDIFFSRKIGNHWTPAKNAGAPVNSAAWESQPAISGNGQYLYFASNRAGGQGAKDIWRCQLLGFKENGMPNWGAVENLGDSINTPENEISPFIHPDGTSLYFASNGWDGLGKDDIFISRLSNDSVWSRAKNIGYPINSELNEQGFIVDAKATKAYYASDRAGSGGLDIYSFDLYDAIRPTPVSYVEGLVADALTAQSLAAKVDLIDLGTSQLLLSTNAHVNTGTFLACLPLGSDYALNVSMPGYLFYSDHFSLKEIHEANEPYTINIALQPIELGSTMTLQNIFFAYDSAKLDALSFVELNRLKEFLLSNPNVKIEIAGHTDNQGSDAYNQQLSTNRAKAVYDYMLSIGIDESRITYKGYGKTKPLVPNDSPEGQAKNRRTEFTIIRLDL